MKQWTQHDARNDHLVEADQFNRQHRSFRGSIAGLDRTQLPTGCAAEADTLAEQFQALTYQEFQSGWTTAFEDTLTPFKGGSLLTDWCGNVAQQVFFTWTLHARGSSTPIGRANDRNLGLRVLYNGLVVCERLGPAKPMDSFRMICESQVPAGPVRVTLQFKATSIGPDDPVEETTTNKDLMQAHLFSNRVVFVGRWR